MSTLKSVYVLCCDNGESYDDFVWWIHGIYRSKVSAVEAAVKLCKETIGVLPEGFLNIWDGKHVYVDYEWDFESPRKFDLYRLGSIWISEKPLQGELDGE